MIEDVKKEIENEIKMLDQASRANEFELKRAEARVNEIKTQIENVKSSKNSYEHALRIIEEKYEVPLQNP